MRVLCYVQILSFKNSAHGSSTYRKVRLKTSHVTPYTCHNSYVGDSPDMEMRNLAVRKYVGCHTRRVLRLKVTQ